jgi:membrane protein YdbS with pleckstrin-like domain
MNVQKILVTALDMIIEITLVTIGFISALYYWSLWPIIIVTIIGVILDLFLKKLKN